MPATLIGTVGIHGIDADESGMIIESLDDTSKKKSNFLENRVGERVGRSDFDESIQIEIKGKIASTAGWAQKISAELTLTNTITGAHLQTASAGTTLIDEVKRSRKNDNWNEIAISAEMLPFFPAS